MTYGHNAQGEFDLWQWLTEWVDDLPSPWRQLGHFFFATIAVVGCLAGMVLYNFLTMDHSGMDCDFARIGTSWLCR